ncbi:hypothetical protein Q4566_06840 [Tamlana sp. 2_MG-2023]|uniref:hypothetical protein n=1 Tax=unclassified Tamlana TaxID=2614803 RepID=UPI0026E47C8A|nr:MULTISPECIES: hypothetical protein [unclassified Tamlana]MDO6759912.1 hypothetical protein [Tamlana sp. 2_MG-2023]MDO6791918.1 hypothetical protein [Tamlana sp. 1_MG-2023]
MDKLLKSISYIFHPLIMPIAGVAFYFAKSPRFIPVEIITAKLISISILTVILPILLFFLLKILGKVESIHLSTAKQRILPLMLNCVILLLVIKKIVTPNQSIELYFFFVGILISNMACMCLAVFGFKASIHMIGVNGLIMFFIALSIHYSININGTLALMAIITGAVATSRLHLKAHNSVELITGAFIGFIPQLILVPYWL